MLPPVHTVANRVLRPVYCAHAFQEAPSHDADEDGEDHGGLVKKILETKKELEHGSHTKQPPKKTTIVSRLCLVNGSVKLRLSGVFQHQPVTVLRIIL